MEFATQAPIANRRERSQSRRGFAQASTGTGVAALAILLYAAVAAPETTTIRANGVVTAVDSNDGHLPIGPPAIGAPFVLEYDYVTTTPDALPGDPARGEYVGAVTRCQVTIGANSPFSVTVGGSGLGLVRVLPSSYTMNASSTVDGMIPSPGTLYICAFSLGLLSDLANDALIPPPFAGSRPSQRTMSLAAHAFVGPSNSTSDIVQAVVQSVTVVPALDTDGDGVLDALDNCAMTPNPTQLDANQDGYGNICDADLNNSGTVTTADFGLLRSVLNQAAGSSPTAEAADLNGSGTVTTADFAILRPRLNTPPGPSGLACAGTVPCP